MGWKFLFKKKVETKIQKSNTIVFWKLKLRPFEFLVAYYSVICAPCMETSGVLLANNAPPVSIRNAVKLVEKSELR